MKSRREVARVLIRMPARDSTPGLGNVRPAGPSKAPTPTEGAAQPAPQRAGLIVVARTDAPTLTSTVKWFNGERGFITADDGYRDIFYHSGQLFDQDHDLSKRDLRAAVSPSGS